MPKKVIVEELPFLMIEEGVKKNQASERLRQYLWTKVSERAQIEMKYIKLLQSWLDSFNPFLNQEGGSEVYLDSEVVKKLITSMKNEVLQTMASRQKIYNEIMSDDGAYNKIGEIKAHCQNGKNLKHLMDEFNIINSKKKDMFVQHRKHIDRKSHLANEIEEIERQMSQTSRLANSRRGTERGAKRIDEMRNRLSMLRRKHDLEMDQIKTLESELFEVGTSTKLPLEELDKQLYELEDRRVRTILGHVKNYLNVVQGNNMTRSPSLDFRRKQRLNELDGVDSLLKVHWQDVSSNAKRSEVGEKFKLRELFTVTNEKSKAHMHLETDGGKNSPISNEADLNSHVQEKKQSRIPFFSSKTKKDSSNTEIVDRETAASDSYSADGRRSRINFTEEYFKNLRSRNGEIPPKAISDESIEELELPPEIWCQAEVTRQTPNKQFLVRKGMQLAQEITEMMPSETIEYSRVAEFTTGEESDEDPEVGKIRNVRMIAVLDNPVPAAGSELSFKKGQLIKQKVGKNEEGFCYGWTREHPLGKKRYGYYRPSMVRRCNPKRASLEE